MGKGAAFYKIWNSGEFLPKAVDFCSIGGEAASRPGNTG
jgi:hypothetical protein